MKESILEILKSTKTSLFEFATIYNNTKEGFNQKSDKDIPRIIVDCDYEAFVDEIVLV